MIGRVGPVVHHGGVTGSQAHPPALVAEVRRLRAADPLGRITVIVPSFGAARDLVRALALSGGAVNVAVRTAAQIVDELSAPVLAPRAAVPFPLLAAAVDKALDADPGRLAAVAAEPVTGQAVARACLRLGTVEPGSVAAETPLHSEVLRLAGEAHEMTGGAYYTQHEAVTTALERLDDLGRVVLAAPLRGTHAERRLRVALSERGVTPVAGTGSDHLASAAEPASADAVTGTHVLHASDSDDEVRAVVRFVRSRLAEGVPGHRIGVYYPSPDPYLRLLHRAFAEAGIAVYGPSDSTLGRSPAGRSLVRLLRLDTSVMPRAELLSIIAEGSVTPLDDSGVAVSSRRVETLTRTRFPVIGGGDWDRLDEHLRTEPEASGESEVLGESDRAAASALLRLIRLIRSGLAAVDAARTWTEAADAVRGLVTAAFRQGPDRAAVLAVVGALADLDAIAPAIPGTAWRAPSPPVSIRWATGSARRARAWPSGRSTTPWAATSTRSAWWGWQRVCCPSSTRPTRCCPRGPSSPRRPRCSTSVTASSSSRWPPAPSAGCARSPAVRCVAVVTGSRPAGCSPRSPGSSAHPSTPLAGRRTWPDALR